MKKGNDEKGLEELLKLSPEEIRALPYETAIDYLEIVVTSLEKEGTSLALGLRLYELGTELGKRCETQLDQTEARMVQLLGDGPSAKEENFDPEKDGR